MCQVLSSTVFFLVSYMHIHYAIMAKTVFVVFQEIHNFNHDDVCCITELYLSTKFHENFENNYLTLFLGISFFNQSYLLHNYLHTKLARSLIHHTL